MQDLRDFTIFLHGPSGSGKGEVQRKITEKYGERGIQVSYISSGDLYREAFAKPEIANIMKRGGFFDTLGAIIPGLQERYQQFLTEWQESKGQRVLVLDGLIRRGTFTNNESTVIPSQIEQLAGAIAEVRRNSALLVPNDMDAAIAEITEAKHLLIDIDPRDAERQMKSRANKEVDGIRHQLQERIGAGYVPFESTALFSLLLNHITAVINAEIKTEAEFEAISVNVQEIRGQIAASLAREGGGSFASFFRQFGVESQLRDDDISPVARRKRIENYVSVTQTPEGTTYSPGFAAQALIDGLGFQFAPDGSFSSTRDNCIVLKNGQSKGIELVTFQGECEQAGVKLRQETNEARLEIFHDPEGHRKRKES